MSISTHTPVRQRRAQSLPRVVSYAALTLLLAGCSTSPSQDINTGTASSFDPLSYESITGIEPITDSLEQFNLPDVELTEGNLETAFLQAAENSQYVQENAGSVQREDFRDGEFMTYVYSPEAETVTGGYWYLQNDGTSSFGRIFTPLALDSEDYELPISALDKVEEFVDKEFSFISPNIISINFGDIYEFRYTIESGLITQIERIENTEDPDKNPRVFIEYGDTSKTLALANRIQQAVEGSLNSSN